MANWGGLPSIVSALPNDLRNFLQRVKETLDGAMTGNSRFVTVGDLVNGNVAALDTYGNVITNNNQAFDFSPPPAPTNLTAVGAITTIMLQWDDPLYANFAYAEIWRASVDNQGVAVLIGTSSGVLYADAVAAQSSYYYWVRFISKANITGAFNAISGTIGATSADPSALLVILSGQVTASQLHATLGSRINLIDAPAIGLIAQVGAITTQAIPLIGEQTDALAFAINELSLQASAAQQKLLFGKAVTDATITVDQATGTITLNAVEALKNGSDITLNIVETTLNAHDASIISNASSISSVSGRITSAESTIAQHSSDISLRATKTELNDVAAAILAGFTPAYTWAFNGTTESWTANAATLTAFSYDMEVAETGAGAYITSPAISVVGATYALIYLKLDKKAGTGWTGKVQYQTSGHGYSDSHYKVFAQPTWDATYKVLALDMTTLTAGGNDWETSTITGIRIFLGAGSGDTTDIDTIEIGKSQIDQILTADINARLGSAEVNIDANASAIALKASQTTVDGHEARLTTAEADIDANAAAITLKAASTAVTAIDARLGAAEIDIDANTASISSKASIVTVDALDTRVSTAESNIDANTGSISLVTSQSQEAASNVNAVGDSLLSALLGLDNTLGRDRASSYGVATAMLEISSAVDALGAEAAARLLLEAAYQSTAAALSNDYYTKAAADAAVASYTASMSAAAFKQRIYRQPAAPTSVTLFIGDAWIDTANNYRISYWDGTAWQLSQDTRIAANAAAIILEQSVRASADSAAASSITTLQSSVAAAQSSANAAQTTANTAVSDAATAQTAANTANTALANIASDNILSPSEKPSVVQDYGVITSEQAGIDAQATTYAITTEKTAYDNAVSALTSYLGTLTEWNTIPGSDVTIVGTTFRAKFSDVYTARQALLNAISAKAKTLADAAQAQANTGVTNAAAAQTTANTAVSDAATAQTAANTANTALANIASDNILSPSEKPSVVQDYGVITSEQAGIDAQATTYTITTEKTAYDNAVAALTNYLGTLTGWNIVPGGDVVIVGTTFRGKFADVYASRQALLNAIASKAKTLADTAQAQANTATSNAATAQSTANTAVSDAAAAASTANTVQARLDTGDFAAVKEESSASASAVAGLSAEYSLKLDVNGYVSGYGTVNDGTSSEFLIATDRFGIVAPTLNSDTEPATKYNGLIWKNTSASTVAGVLSGESRRWVVVGGAGSWQPVGFGAMPFAVLTTSATINGVAFQPGVYIDGASIVEASIGTAQIGNAAVDSASIANGAIHDIHVGDLAASKITTGTLQASHQISVGDSVVIDGAGHIRTFGAGNVGARDYSSLESGNLYLYRYIVDTGQTVQYNYLSRMESGIANSGDTVAIPGYFRNQPKVMVSPAGIGLYKQAYANQDQSLTCAATNISETSSGSAQWAFDATATLTLGSNTGTAVVNSSSGAISSNTYNSAHQTTPANCASTTVSISLLSVRGNGISQYLYRQVSWRIGYRVSGSGSAYSFTTARIKAIGAITSGSVQDSALVSFPSANTWEFYVEYVASDVNTSTFGAISYTYSDETLSGQSGIIAQASADLYPVTVNGSGGNLPASAVNTSWEIYKIDYTLQYDIVFFATNSSGSYDYGTGNAAISIRGTQVAFEEEPFYTYTSNESRYNVVVSHSYTGSNLGRDVNPVTASAYAFGGSQYYGFVTTARIDSLVEKIYRRNPIANSTTPSNEFIFDSHNYSLSSAQVLAYGSLNWLAVGM